MKLLLTIAAIFICIVAYSQISFDASVGLNIGNLHSKTNGTRQEGLKASVSYTIPLHVNIPIAKSFIFQTGLEYESIRHKNHGTYHYVYVEGGETDYFDSKSHLDYINIPIKICYKMNSRFQVGFGPYVGMGVSGKDKGSIHQHIINMLGSSDYEIQYINKVKFGSEDSETKRINLGLGLNIAYTFSKKILAGFYSNFGLSDINNGAAYKSRTITGGLTIGYLFGKKASK